MLVSLLIAPWFIRELQKNATAVYWEDSAGGAVVKIAK
jgi:hypothetical protein